MERGSSSGVQSFYAAYRRTGGGNELAKWRRQTVEVVTDARRGGGEVSEDGDVARQRRNETGAAGRTGTMVKAKLKLARTGTMAIVG
ncbi:hypothetical protein [Cohnella fermenti]|uniref:Uncharacterized protein n=1 Tax=Cohnella fermenti TaxID=2565925 RepID=A0A4S4BKY9_9BACL|nr:hypothetical protein [Cohnella fermenti]THF74800.1 hypothetical protein E6C55_23740 [Cohnella fermenti]